MRSLEARVAETKRRIAAEKRRQRLRRVMGAAAAACLALITGCALAMPELTGRPDAYSGYETTASMFGGGSALGYIAIGLLAFLLGVCVTVLCFRLRRLEREAESEERHGAD